MKAYHYLIKGPIITEKTHSLREAANKLTFRVAVKANKIEIRKAIEDIFKVKVLGVNTVHVRGKRRRWARPWECGPTGRRRSSPWPREKRSPVSRAL